MHDVNMNLYQIFHVLNWFDTWFSFLDQPSKDEIQMRHDLSRRSMLYMYVDIEKVHPVPRCVVTFNVSYIYKRHRHHHQRHHQHQSASVISMYWNCFTQRVDDSFLEHFNHLKDYQKLYLLLLIEHVASMFVPLGMSKCLFKLRFYIIPHTFTHILITRYASF